MHNNERETHYSGHVSDLPGHPLSGFHSMPQFAQPAPGARYPAPTQRLVMCCNRPMHMSENEARACPYCHRLRFAQQGDEYPGGPQ